MPKRYKTVPRALSMLETALDQEIRKFKQFHNPPDLVSGITDAQNWGFVVAGHSLLEQALKLLLSIRCGKQERGHQLRPLFDLLPESDRECLRDWYQDFRSNAPGFGDFPIEDVDDFLQELDGKSGRASIDWRYYLIEEDAAPRSRISIGFLQETAYGVLGLIEEHRYGHSARDSFFSRRQDWPKDDDLLADLKRISDQINKSGSILHVTRDDRASREIGAATDFMESFNETADVGISDVWFNNNQDDRQTCFPDCFGLLDSALIGLEETTAVSEFKEAILNQHDVQFAQHIAGALEKILTDKERSAQEEGREWLLQQLESLFLLVQVDNPIAPSSELGKHLQEIRLPRSKYIDRMFILSPPCPSDNPVVREKIHEPLTERERKSKLCGLFEIGFYDRTEIEFPDE